MGWEKVIVEVVKHLYNSDYRKKLFSKKKFLNYDIQWLVEQYSEEENIDQYLPYKEVVRWLEPTKEETLLKISNIKLCINEEKFQLSADTSNLKAFQGESLALFKEVGKMTSNEKIIHLEEVEVNNNTTKLHIQPARYSDQAQSNLVMDWEEPHTLSKGDGIKSLRSYMTPRYGLKLPPLNEKILANTIGVSVIMLYREKNELIPYLPQRVGNKYKDLLRETGRTTKNVAVFEGGYHCTASGATQWGPGETFDSAIVDDIYNELREEVGLEKKHIDILVPVALCREFLRAGKPQIFFVGVTNCSRKELDILRAEAIKITLGIRMVPEIHNKAISYKTNDDLYSSLKTKGITIEAAANLYYVEDFIDTFQVK